MKPYEHSAVVLASRGIAPGCIFAWNIYFHVLLKMNSTLKLLESHSGRGRILRTVQYGSKMVAGTTFVNEQSRNGLLVLSSQLGLCRTILRLFDDLPMLSYTMSYGLGSQVCSTRFVLAYVIT